MADRTNQRKLEHLDIIASDREVDRGRRHFDAIHLTHRALPELDLAAIDPSLEILGRRLSFPLLISSMTGGDDELLRRVNRHLALAAEATGVAMGVGSQRVMFTHPAARASFALREFAPKTLLFANLGAVQLNYGFDETQCRTAIEVLGADALYLHLNPLQEAIQPEGNTKFAGLAARLGALVSRLPVPVVLKEVGSGLSRTDAELALTQGIRYLDVAGAGGTSWSRIEAHRAGGLEALTPGVVFQDWGLPTPLALRQLAPLRDQATLFASGGLRHGLDMVKAVILGAHLCGLAAPFLAPARESPEAVIAVIEQLRRHFVTAMFLLGMPDLQALRFNDSLIVYEGSP